LDVIADLTTRLVPLGVPVLRPEQFHEPEAYAELTPAGRVMAGGRKGLGPYLEANPVGYVQLHDPTPITTSISVLDSHLVQIDAIAPTVALAMTLASATRMLVSNTPRHGGRYRTLTPPRTERLPNGVTRVTLQFELNTPSTGSGA